MVRDFLCPKIKSFDSGHFLSVLPGNLLSPLGIITMPSKICLLFLLGGFAAGFLVAKSKYKTTVIA